jgi:hypothetical protein
MIFMGLKASFQQLQSELILLRDSLKALDLTIREDKPLLGDVLLVDRLEDAVTDLTGWLEEAVEIAEQNKKSLEWSGEINSVAKALCAIHDSVNRIGAALSFDIAGYESIRTLLSMGRERGGEWRPWTKAVKTAIDRSLQTLRDVNNAILRSWQELADRLAMGSISVQSTNIGQQITVENDRVEASGNVK